MAVPDKNKIVSLKEMIFNHDFGEILIESKNRRYTLPFEQDRELLLDFQKQLSEAINDTRINAPIRVEANGNRNNEEYTSIHFHLMTNEESSYFLNHLSEQIKVILREYREAENGRYPTHLFTHI